MHKLCSSLQQNTPQAGAQSTNASVSEGLTSAIAVPIVTPRSHSVMPTQELNLDNIHFTQLPPDDQQQRLKSSFSIAVLRSLCMIGPVRNFKCSGLDESVSISLFSG